MTVRYGIIGAGRMGRTSASAVADRFALGGVARECLAGLPA